MKIFFIRHGESTGDIENLYGGDYDDHLSEKGREQARDLAQLLKDKDIEIIFSSPLSRAKEVSEILASMAGCKVIVENDLRERNQYGILTGINKDEAKNKFPEQVELLKNRFNTVEGAEAYTDFSKRITGTFEKIKNNPEYKTVAIVTHGGPMRVLFRDILKWGELVEIGDCSYVELEKKDNIFIPIHYERLKPDFEMPFDS